VEPLKDIRIVELTTNVAAPMGTGLLADQGADVIRIESVGEGDPETGWVVRAYVHPFVVWIWLGALMTALAGFVSILDRGRKS